VGHPSHDAVKHVRDDRQRLGVVKYAPEPLPSDREVQWSVRFSVLMNSWVRSWAGSSSVSTS